MQARRKANFRLSIQILFSTQGDEEDEHLMKPSMVVSMALDSISTLYLLVDKPSSSPLHGGFGKLQCIFIFF